MTILTPEQQRTRIVNKIAEARTSVSYAHQLKTVGSKRADQLLRQAKAKEEHLERMLEKLDRERGGNL